jgi:uncharacterized membrane protein HdeD (DUF308 family)
MSAKQPSMTTIKPLRFMAIGVGLVLLGIAAMASPVITGTAAMVAIGTVLVLGGVGQFLETRRQTSALASFLGSITSVLSILCGILIAIQPLTGFAFLGVLLVLYFLAEGFALLVLAIRIRRFDGWQWVLANGILAILLGLLFWSQWPLSGTWEVGLLVGLHVALAGASLVFLGSRARRASIQRLATSTPGIPA